MNKFAVRPLRPTCPFQWEVRQGIGQKLRPHCSLHEVFGGLSVVGMIFQTKISLPLPRSKVNSHTVIMHSHISKTPMCGKRFLTFVGQFVRKFLSALDRFHGGVEIPENRLLGQSGGGVLLGFPGVFFIAQHNRKLRREEEKDGWSNGRQN